MIKVHNMLSFMRSVLQLVDDAKLTRCLEPLSKFLERVKTVCFRRTVWYVDHGHLTTPPRSLSD